jgi:hypothetical protein
MGNDGLLTLSNRSVTSSSSSNGYNIYADSNGNINAQYSASISEDISTFLNTGWTNVVDTWTYLNGSAVTVPSTYTTATYSVGDKVKFTQGASVKYFYITYVSSTILYLVGGSDYTVSNTGITNIYYSHMKCPAGFPKEFNYTPVWYANNYVPPLELGNGTLEGIFNLTGRICNIQLNFVWGTTTSASAYYPWYWATPVSPDGSFPVTVWGVSHIRNAATANYTGKMQAGVGASGGIIIGFCGDEGSPLWYIQYDIPFTWGNGDSMATSLSYWI